MDNKLSTVPWSIMSLTSSDEHFDCFNKNTNNPIASYHKMVNNHTAQKRFDYFEGNRRNLPLEGLDMNFPDILYNKGQY